MGGEWKGKVLCVHPSPAVEAVQVWRWLHFSMSASQRWGCTCSRIQSPGTPLNKRLRRQGGRWIIWGGLLLLFFCELQKPERLGSLTHSSPRCEAPEGSLRKNKHVWWDVSRGRGRWSLLSVWSGLWLLQIYSLAVKFWFLSCCFSIVSQPG